MGRGRGKGKKQSLISARDDAGSGEEEKLPVRRRGRPQKPLKDDVEEEIHEVLKIEEDHEMDDTKSSEISRSAKNHSTATENCRKRKRPSQVKENADPPKEENGVGTKTDATESIKSVGYRQNSSRRKNKPRRAAEVGVECI